VIPKQMRSQMTLDRMAQGGVGRNDILYGIPSEPGRLVGDFYLDSKWNNGTIMLIETETLIEGYPIKYDLKSQSLEIQSKAGIKVLDAKKVKSLVWIDSLTQKPYYFINAAEFTEDGTPLRGLIEVAVDGNLPLFCRSTIWVKKPDYVPALDVGSKDEIINKRRAYYYSSGKELVKITTKKKLLPIFGDEAKSVQNFIKVNALSVNDPTHLRRIFEFYNSKK
jgi:hypothetical protein